MSELKPRITENGIDYILVGDYYIPDLKLPEEHRPIGKYGRLHREYLREVHPVRLNTLILTGELWTYLADLNEQAQERLDTIMEQMKATEGVTEGIPLWDMPTMEGDVLYLCLEDTFCRIQDRLFRLTDEASRRLHFAVASCKLSDGLIVQLEDYLKDYPDSRLIVIDTLQKVRTASKDNAYASDYGDISLIKDFADRHSLAVIVVHHIRKQNDSDVFNKVSGTTGLTGSADATFVLEKEKRASDTAKLYVTGRDTPYQEYTLRFRDCRWELVERKTQEQLAKETIPDVLFRLVDFMRDKEEWIGTATELLAAMGETETIPTVITKWLNEYRTTFLSENRICYQYSRRKDGRRIALARRAGDSGDGGDSDIRIPPCYCH